jgi:hypothetical protein
LLNLLHLLYSFALQFVAVSPPLSYITEMCFHSRPSVRRNCCVQPALHVTKMSATNIVQRRKGIHTHTQKMKSTSRERYYFFMSCYFQCEFIFAPFARLPLLMILRQSHQPTVPSEIMFSVYMSRMGLVMLFRSVTLLAFFLPFFDASLLQTFCAAAF